MFDVSHDQSNYHHFKTNRDSDYNTLYWLLHPVNNPTARQNATDLLAFPRDQFQWRLDALFTANRHMIEKARLIRRRIQDIALERGSESNSKRRQYLWVQQDKLTREYWKVDHDQSRAELTLNAIQQIRHLGEFTNDSVEHDQMCREVLDLQILSGVDNPLPFPNTRLGVFFRRAGYYPW